MRKIYESDALVRDDGPFSPREPDDDDRPQAARWINSAAWSDRLVPHRLRCRSVTIQLSVPDRRFAVGEPVPFRVAMTNRLPVPISIRTASPLLWTWSVDGHDGASHVPRHDPPDRPGRLRFDRGERKRFEKQWSGMFQVSETEWRPATPGEHTIRVAINVRNGAGRELFDEAVVSIEAEPDDGRPAGPTDRSP